MGSRRARKIAAKVLGGKLPEPPVLVIDEFDHYHPHAWDSLSAVPVPVPDDDAPLKERSVIIRIDDRGHEHIVIPD
jgi:hypothetical protein